MSRLHIIKATAIVGILTSASRLLGLLRQMLMANFFGTSLASSAFILAFRIPNLFRAMFGEGALSASFIPIFTKNVHSSGLDDSWKLANKVFSMLTAILSTIILIVIAGIQLYRMFVPMDEETALVLPLTQIMFPYMLFICLAALSMAILNSLKRFAVPAISPILLNVIWIAALLFLCPFFRDSMTEGIYVVAITVTVAGILQFLVQYPELHKQGFRLKLTADWRDARVTDMIKMMMPVAFSSGVVLVNLTISSILAMKIANWGPAAVYYADVLVYLPLGMIATALSTVMFPEFSKMAAASDTAGIRTGLHRSIRAIFFIMIPASAGMTALCEPLVRFLYEHGQFTPESTSHTVSYMIYYAPGLVVFSLYRILPPVFYSLKDTRTPFIASVTAVAINLTLNLIFITVLPWHLKLPGLAVASVVASFVSCIILGIAARKKIGNIGWPGLTAYAAKPILASAIMVLAAIYAERQAAEMLGATLIHTKIQQGLSLSAGMLAGLASYGLISFIFFRKEVQMILDSRRKPRIA